MRYNNRVIEKNDKEGNKCRTKWAENLENLFLSRERTRLLWSTNDANYGEEFKCLNFYSVLITIIITTTTSFVVGVDVIFYYLLLLLLVFLFILCFLLLVSLLSSIVVVAAEIVIAVVVAMDATEASREGRGRNPLPDPTCAWPAWPTWRSACCRCIT